MLAVTIKTKVAFFAVLIFAIVLTACGSEVIYENSVKIPQNGWHKDTVAVFKSEISQLKESYHLLLQVKNTDKYQYSNVWFFIDAISPSGNVQRDTIDCILANPAGDWFGKSSWRTDDFTSYHPYKINIQFPETGTYKYYVVQGMRDTVLTGVEAIGVQILKVK